MKFGPQRLEDANGAILAHSLRLGKTVLKKGRVLGARELDAIAAAGLDSVTVARLERTDVGEDEAARRVATAIQGPNVTADRADTGRVNLRAAVAGLVSFDPCGIDAVNAVTDDITLATLSRFAPVEADRMIATVKIIPFAVDEDDLAQCLTAAETARMEVKPFKPLSAGLIQTLDDRLKPSVVEKTSAITVARLTRLGSTMHSEVHSAHNIDALTAAIAAQLAEKVDILLVIGASAIVDRQDVIPGAIERLGGRLERLGMPVDPGNLILLAEIDGRPILGLPGCARSPARNGLDWVLERLAAGMPAGRDEIAHMGVGGLLIGSEQDMGT